MKPKDLVTGASSGIGRALCKECVSKGWKTIGVARSADKLQTLQTELGEELFHPIVCDVSDTRAVYAASLELFNVGLIPSLFFLNAGMAGEEVMEELAHLDFTKHQKTMAVNYFGVLSWVDFWQKICQEHGGAFFMATSSILAFLASPRGSAYAASKAAIARAFEGLNMIFSGTNLRFSVVYPGPVSTKALVGKWPFTKTPEQMATYMIRCALKGKGHCEPQLLYSILARLVRSLPQKWVLTLWHKI